VLIDQDGRLAQEPTGPMQERDAMLPNKHPLVAVVTPVYNGGKFLATAMRSVQAQTYRPLLHVVLDNASSDATSAIIQRFQGLDVPVLTKRNVTVLPVARNWSEAVRMVPNEAKYFKLLCADDCMRADAIAQMIKVVGHAGDVRVVFGIDNYNGVPRWSNLPPALSIFESSNMLARIWSDLADLPYHHAMYRADLRDPAIDFFDSKVIGFDADATFRILFGGGRCGFVHDPIFETIGHAESLTSTWTNKVAAQSLERLARFEHYGPAALSHTEYQRIAKRELRTLYRKLLWRLATGNRTIAKRDLQLLAKRGRRPTLTDLALSILTWPGHLYHRKVTRLRPHPPWPATAAKPAEAEPVAPALLPERNAS
jgi:glycosyltransferase involved in cell wall biosynthesis